MKRLALLATIALSLFAVAAHAQIVNGDFETGDFAGWTVNDSSDYILIGNNPTFSYSGTYHADLGSFETIGSLSQTFNTAAGQVYDLSFALANDGQAPPNQFEVYWDNTLVFSMTDAPPSNNYQVFTISNLVAQTASTTLEFRNRNDSDFFRLDDIAATAVPEPSTVALGVVGLGFIGLAAGRRLRARA